MKLLSITLLLTLLAFSCTKNDSHTNLECHDLVCTEQFVSILIPISGALTFPSNYSTVSTIRSTGKELHTSIINEFGYVTICDDADFDLIEKEGIMVDFKVYNDKGISIYDTEFQIGHDCCHVIKIAGPDKIVL